jgi:hypothetical protein
MKISVLLGFIGLLAGITSAWYWWQSSQTKITSDLTSMDRTP